MKMVNRLLIGKESDHVENLRYRGNCRGVQTSIHLSGLK